MDGWTNLLNRDFLLYLHKHVRIFVVMVSIRKEKRPKQLQLLFLNKQDNMKTTQIFISWHVLVSCWRVLRLIIKFSHFSDYYSTRTIAIAEEKDNIKESLSTFSKSNRNSSQKLFVIVQEIRKKSSCTIPGFNNQPKQFYWKLNQKS